MSGGAAVAPLEATLFDRRRMGPKEYEVTAYGKSLGKRKAIEVFGSARLNRKYERYTLMSNGRLTLSPGWTSLSAGARVFRLLKKEK